MREGKLRERGVVGFPGAVGLLFDSVYAKISCFSPCCGMIKQPLFVHICLLPLGSVFGGSETGKR